MYKSVYVYVCELRARVCMCGVYVCIRVCVHCICMCYTHTRRRVTHTDTTLLRERNLPPGVYNPTPQHFRPPAVHIGRLYQAELPTLIVDPATRQYNKELYMSSSSQPVRLAPPPGHVADAPPGPPVADAPPPVADAPPGPPVADSDALPPVADAPPGPPVADAPPGPPVADSDAPPPVGIAGSLRPRIEPSAQLAGSHPPSYNIYVPSPSVMKGRLGHCRYMGKVDRELIGLHRLHSNTHGVGTFEGSEDVDVEDSEEEPADRKVERSA